MASKQIFQLEVWVTPAGIHLAKNFEASTGGRADHVGQTWGPDGAGQ